jgi:aminodeoxychorismate synthase component I
MRVVPLVLRRDPLAVLATLASEPGAFLVDVPDPVRPVTLLGCRPSARLVIGPDGARTLDPLTAIAGFVAETAGDDPVPPFPFGPLVVGYLGYELGRLIEPPSRPGGPPPDLPLAALARYETLLVFDRTRGQYALVTPDGAPRRVPWLDRVAAAPAARPVWEGPFVTAPLAPLWSRERYLASVERIRAYLTAGDVYQVNLTQPWEVAFEAPPHELHARLARLHPVPHGAFLDLGDHQLVANSPELFLRRRGPHLTTRPIKGTRSRGTTPAHDAALIAELRRDPKERAEHVMIVDLERNDLGRVATPGSVAVEGLAEVESHATVHHLVSTVSARLRAGVGLAEILRATFPGGSITGAPKVRAMEVIRELEPWPRGPYTGAFGVFHPGGDLELGLGIRTAVVRDGRLRWHAGGGIVIESDPERELAEAWLKTAALRLALGGTVEPGLAACSSG